MNPLELVRRYPYTIAFLGWMGYVMLIIHLVESSR